MSIYQQLIDMGFDKEKAEAASKGSENLEAAVEWIMAEQAGAPAPTPAPASSAAPDPAAPQNSESAVNNEEVTAAAASFKCNDCGKLFRNEGEIMFHATKTKHENFSESAEEIKPLTAEEKQVKVAELRQKIREAQEKKAKLASEEQREKERKRRDDGKAAVARKDELREREYREAAEQRKREKYEEDSAKRRVLEQIRLDREARKARAENGKVEQVKPVQAPVAPVAPAAPKNYDTTTIQFRLLDGKIVKQQFQAKEPLAMVRAWIETNHSDGLPFSLMTPFPRTVFTDEHLEMPLNKLDLVPSANIVIVRRDAA